MKNIKIFLITTLLFTVILFGNFLTKTTLAATSTSVASSLKSNFLKNDPTAQAIASGMLDQYDITALPTIGPFDTAIFAYRFVSALRMLGYTASFMSGNQAENFLKNFEKVNGFAPSSLITKQILLAVDSKLAAVELRDLALAKNLPIFKYYMDAPVNEPTKEHAAALFAATFKSLPSHLVVWNEQGFMDYLGFQQPGRLKYERASDTSTVCDPTMYNQIIDTCKIGPSQITSYSNDFDDATLLIHEYAHYLDGNIFQKATGVLRGSIDTTGFYGISFNVSDLTVATNGWKFYSYKNPSNIKNDFLSAYAQGWSNGDGSSYYTAYEDFAESFAMYVTEGKTFRELAKKNLIFSEKYNWLKQKVFKGTEYSTGVDNAIALIKNNINHPNQTQVDTNIFNIEDFSLAVPGFVWNFNFPSYKSAILPIPCLNGQGPLQQGQMYCNSSTSTTTLKIPSTIIKSIATTTPAPLKPTPIATTTPVTKTTYTSYNKKIKQADGKRWSCNTGDTLDISKGSTAKCSGTGCVKGIVINATSNKNVLAATHVTTNGANLREGTSVGTKDWIEATVYCKHKVVTISEVETPIQDLEGSQTAQVAQTGFTSKVKSLFKSVWLAVFR